MRFDCVCVCVCVGGGVEELWTGSATETCFFFFFFGGGCWEGGSPFYEIIFLVYDYFSCTYICFPRPFYFIFTFTSL